MRMEPQLMILGQSSAIIANLAIRNTVNVQDIPYEKLRTALISNGQILKK
jgi:hypothetical protein